MIFEPESILVAPQAVIRRAVHAPPTKHVSRNGSPKLHLKCTVDHIEIPHSYLWPRLIWMRNQLDFDNPRPLNIVVRALVCLGLFIEQRGVVDSRDNEITELSDLAVKRSDVPAQTCVDQC